MALLFLRSFWGAWVAIAGTSLSCGADAGVSLLRVGAMLKFLIGVCFTCTGAAVAVLSDE